jgi:tripartite-type tricarboxylate transporter receptor subunit TctC
MSLATAAEFPTKPVRLVVPFPPGGGADTLARQVGQRLAQKWNQQTVIDNRGGAGGLIGTEIVFRAASDGYTLLFATQSTHGTNPSLYRKLPYDPVAGFIPVAMVASVPNVLVVHPSVAATNVKELIALAKQKPGALNYASVGTGSSQHLTGELFKSRSGININHVPYKGTGPALIELVSGQVQMMFTNLITSVGHMKSAKLRGLAVTSRARSSAAPELPTVAEVIPGFEAVSWYGIVAPAGTPPSVVNLLNRDINAVLAEQSLRERLLAGGAEPAGGTPRNFADYIREEIRKYADVAKLAGIQPE